MSICYEFMIYAACPVDGSRDVYDAKILTDTQINVERINSAARSYEHAVIFQEALTTEMFRTLGFSGSLTTVGMHSGVRVTVTCST